MTTLNGVLGSIQRRKACLKLFHLHRLEWLKRYSSGKTRIQNTDWQQVSHLASQARLPQEISLLASEQFSRNTNETLDILVRVAATFPSGQKEVSYYGTPYLVAEMVNHFLMTGGTAAGTTSPEKSSGGVTNGASSSSSSELLPNDIWPRFPTLP